MTLVILAIAFVFILLLAYWIFSPWLVSNDLASLSNPLLRKLEKLHFDREMVLENLQDLELDRNMGKLDLKDYDELRARMLSQAASIYLALEKLEQEDPLLMELQKSGGRS